MERTLALDSLVDEDIGKVKEIVKKSPVKNGVYDVVVRDFSAGTRNTSDQIKYIDAYERALSVFRTSALELRKEMDVLNLEQRLGAQRDALGDAQLTGNAQKVESETIELQKQVTDAIFFSNRYALAFAGNVGLALLGSDKVKIDKRFTFGTKYDASKERDALTGMLAEVAAGDISGIVAKQKEQKAEIKDDMLKYGLESIFTAWAEQLNWLSFTDIAKARGVEKTKLQYGNYSMINGEFKKKYSAVEIGDGIMPCRKEDVIPDDEFYDVLWQSFLKLATYNPEKGKASVPAPAVVFTYGPPGCGKTFQSHALIRTFMEDICMKRGIAAKAQIHSVSDFASSYQNQTSLNLATLAEGIRKHQGIDIMYVADADIIFQSRKDPHMTQEQKQTNGVYMSMFDGTRIPKIGKFITIMDANYIDGIDDATKSRVFDKIVEMKRFSKPEQFSALAKNKLMKGVSVQVLTDDEWGKVGRYLLDGPLSNREIDNIISQIRGGLRVPDDFLDLTWEKQIAYRDDYFKSVTLDVILGKFDKYIETRAAMEGASSNAKVVSDEQRFLAWKENLQRARESSSGSGAK